MNGDARPNPEDLLAEIRHKKNREGKGRLKVFFGMSAGVGKTYAMLQAARALQAKGTDVIVGLVETHGRRETEALLDGLPIIPRTTIQYRGITVQEIDLDEILRRHPPVVLVDELAHTNAEGCRHKKRYQDVLELLDRGISVYTTLNVQHLESLVETVAQISGITVRETVPDSLLDEADEIELVDISPEELLQRFSDGKVYTPEQSAAATANFFRMGTLTALREIALRSTAQRVDVQLKDFMRENRITGPWKTVERLMVAVGPGPHSEQLIRWTKRIASTMQAPWIAIYIRRTRPLDEKSELRLKKNIALAQELGADLVTTTDDDIVQALIRTARQNNVTQIIIGKSQTSFFADLFRGGSLVSRLIRESGGIDIYVAQGDISSSDHRASSSPVFMPSLRLQHYMIACGVVIAAALAFMPLEAFIDYRAIGMFFLFIIAAISPFVGRLPIITAAALSAVLWDFLFIPPRFTFAIANLPDIMLVLLYFIIALITGSLATRARSQREALRAREKQAASLFSLVNDLSAADSLDEIVAAGSSHLGRDFNCHISFYPSEPGVELSRSPHPSSTMAAVSDKEWSVAQWVWKNRNPAGKNTNTLPFAEAVYYPLIEKEQCYGVVGVTFGKNGLLPLSQEGHFLMSLQQISMALEHLHLRADRLNKTLLRSISHELRTPVTAIAAASSGLTDPETQKNPGAQKILVDDIQSAAERLNRLVENLLNMTRIESGAVSIRKEWCDVGDFLENLLRDLRNDIHDHPVARNIQDNLPLIELDSILLGQTVTNILINAVQYTPPGTGITLKARYQHAVLTIEIEDAGPGLPPAAIGRLFEKFYRVPGSKPGGTGLGLSIAKGFMEHLGGSIEAANRESGGARFVINLPAKSLDPSRMESGNHG